MAYTKLKLVTDGGVAVLTLCDPPTRNALGPAMCAELTGALAEIAGSSARAVVLTGDGGAFCSGANLGEAAEFARTGGDLREVVERYYNPVARQLRDLPMPLVTAVPGPAAGIGASFAFMGDLVVAADTAAFTPAFARVGLVPDGGATWLLPRLVGKARAMEMVLLGDPIPAAQALDWGLINRCVPGGEVMSTAMDLARRLANGPASLGLSRRLILDGLDGGWERQLGAEADAQGRSGATADFKEGLAAFMEKRPPRFTGR